MQFVFDRTREDVANAKRLKKDKFLKGVSLSDSEKSIMGKGSFSLEDINRIEQNLYDIQTELMSVGYYAQIDEKIDIFGRESVFYKYQIVDWIKRIEALKVAFFPYENTPSEPIARYHYEEINKIEKILFDTQKRFEEMESLFRECGAYECGGD